MKKSSQSGFSAIVLAVIIVLAVVGGGLIAWKQGWIPKFSGETADWKTYRNEEYGFEIKYPPNLSAKTDTNNVVSIGDGKNESLYSLVILKKPINVTPLQYVEEIKLEGERENYAPTIRSYKSIVVNGISGAEAELVGGMGVPFRNVYFLVKGKLLNITYALGDYDYVLNYYFDGNQMKVNEYLENGNILVSTFKFID